MLAKKQKIGEILIENKFITKEILEEALRYQKQYGGNVTQYLIAYGYINEEELAKCISQQFRCPYIPLRAYNISSQVIRLVSSEIAERYWLIPIDKIDDIITVVMVDPFDEEAIKEIEAMTKCKVQPFVGILSDVIKAIEHYYNIRIEHEDLKRDGEKAPLFISTNKYKGIEHRKSIRLNTKINIHFPEQNIYKESQTKNVSMHGFLFESSNILPLGSFVVMEVDLPKEFSIYPIAVVVQVVRVDEMENKKFNIGVKTISILKDDAEKIMKYAISK